MPATANGPESVHDLTVLANDAARGDRDALNELFARSRARFEQMARRMLRRNPAVARWTEADDLIANVSVRLLRALEGNPVTDTRGFFNLSAAAMRRELIDLARKYYGPEGIGANHASRGPGMGSGSGAAPDPASPDPDPADLDRWAELHVAIGRLPAEEREVFGLVFYHKWTQAQIAGVLGVSEKTVRRWFKDAAKRLNEVLGGDFPAE